jgi:hypothetical protein
MQRRIIPTSAPSAPLTPPPPTLDGRTRSVLKAIHQLRRGRPILKSRFRLSRKQFAALEHAIFDCDISLQAWAESRLRFNYDADTREFTLRMPGHLHESFIGHLHKLFLRKFDDLRTNESTSEKDHEILKAIETFAGSPRYELDESRREPDLCFKYRVTGCRHPPFVAEVADSQNGLRDFARISEQYLLATRGKIRTFLGVNLEYRNPKQRSTDQSPRWARVYLWHCEMQQESNGDDFLVTVPRLDEKGVLFQNKDGVVDSSAIICFNLHDFSPPTSDNATSNSTFEITHQELANALAIAEEDARQAEEDAKSSNDEMPVKVVYRHQKREASAEPDEADTEPNTPVDESSFEGPKITDVVERRKSLGRAAKKMRS